MIKNPAVTSASETKPKNADPRAALHAAFSALSILPGKELRLPAIIGAFANIKTDGPGAIPPHFIKDPRRSEAELNRIVKLSQTLINQLDNLHQTSFIAMGDVQARELRVCMLQNTIDRAANALESIRTEKTAADGSFPIRRGRSVDARAEAIAIMTGHYYEQLTGRRPARYFDAHDPNNKSAGPFVDLLKQVFKALGLTKNAEHYAKDVIANFKEENP